jgi:hypothetical protein
MRMRKLIAMAVLLLTFGCFGNLARGGDIIMSAPNGFTAGNTTFPAGNYCVKTCLSDRILIRNTETGKGVILPVLAHLKSREIGDAAVIFTSEGNQNYLSAVYFPGMDGLMLKARPTDHSAVKLASNVR